MISFASGISEGSKSSVMLIFMLAAFRCVVGKKCYYLLPSRIAAATTS